LHGVLEITKAGHRCFARKGERRLMGPKTTWERWDGRGGVRGFENIGAVKDGYRGHCRAMKGGRTYQKGRFQTYIPRKLVKTTGCYKRGIKSSIKDYGIKQRACKGRWPVVGGPFVSSRTGTHTGGELIAVFYRKKVGGFREGEV